MKHLVYIDRRVWVHADRSNVIASAIVESGWTIHFDPPRSVYILVEDWNLACDIWTQLILLKTKDLGLALKPIVGAGRDHARRELDAFKALVALSQ